DIWLVGAAVRHLLTHQPITNPDFTTSATPDQIQLLFPDSFYDNAFGTVGIPIDDEVYEVTTYRTERGYSDRRRPDKVTWGQTLEEDLSRRDFTINAMVIGIDHSPPATSHVQLMFVDPFSGQKDLSARLIRAVGDPLKRFNEDALRLMRAVRIATQLEFTIELQTLQAIKQASTTITAVSWERIRDELFKILSSSHPASGIKLLDDTDLLVHILPELLTTKDIPQGGHHLYDVWNHSLKSLEFCPSSDPLTRLATLLHDVGKTKTLRHQGPRGVTFYGHEVVGARLAQTIADRLKLSKKDKDKLTTLVRWHMFTYSPQMTDSAIRRFIRRVGLDNINDMMLLRVGDRKGGGSRATSWRLRELQDRIGQQLYQPLTVNDLKIDGHDVMKTLKITPGPRVGQILNALFEEVLEDSSKNTRDYLLERTKELGKL
ncbi:MAG: HDIG domain-containing protein, partial [Candidatus Chisholmbacteria bacterium]|nr:HDIG domain-containing protein [Candidatus Chisholmbacteria bacterium]